MPKLPGIRHQDAVRVFEKLGYRSGHIVMSNGETRLLIPRANPVDAYTMGSIARDAGLWNFESYCEQSLYFDEQPSFP